MKRVRKPACQQGMSEMMPSGTVSCSPHASPCSSREGGRERSSARPKRLVQTRPFRPPGSLLVAQGPGRSNSPGPSGAIRTSRPKCHISRHCTGLGRKLCGRGGQEWPPRENGIHHEPWRTAHVFVGGGTGRALQPGAPAAARKLPGTVVVFKGSHAQWGTDHQAAGTSSNVGGRVGGSLSKNLKIWSRKMQASEVSPKTSGSSLC